MQGGTRAWIPVAVLLLLGLTLTLPRLGTPGLWDPWEPKYAQTPREMADRGDWIVPSYREDPRLVKPPVTYWLIGASQSVLGLSETAARLPSALLAALCPAALALAFACRGRRLEGWIAGAALLTSPQWLLAGRFATPDLPFAALSGIALATVIALPALRPGERAPMAVQAVVLVALASLTEWPRGLLLPAWAVLGWGAARLKVAWIALLAVVSTTYYFAQQQESAWMNLVAIAFAVAGAAAILLVEARVPARRLALSALLLALVVAPWFVAVFSAEPEEATERLLGYKHALNLGESPGSHDGPPYEVLRLVAVGALPWFAAALAGLVLGLRRRSGDRDDLATLLAGVWIGGLLFFSLSEAQMGHFYPVLQPALAGIAGIGVVALVRRPGWGLAPTAAIVAVLAWMVWKWREPSVILETATVKNMLFGVVDIATPALLALLLWFALLVAAAVLRRERWALATVAPPLLFAAFLGWYAVPELGPKKSLRPMWERYVAERSEGVPLGSFGSAKDSSFYYSNNAVIRLRSGSDLLEFLDPSGSKYLILTHRDYRKLDRLPLPPGRWDDLPVGHPSHRLVRFTRDAP